MTSNYERGKTPLVNHQTEKSEEKSTSSCSPSPCHSLPSLQEFVFESTSLQSGGFSFLLLLFSEAGTGFCFVDLVKQELFLMKELNTQAELFFYY